MISWDAVQSTAILLSTKASLVMAFLGSSFGPVKSLDLIIKESTASVSLTHSSFTAPLSLILSHFLLDKWKGYCSLNIPSQGSMVIELSKFMYLVRLDYFFTKNKYLTFVSSYLLRNKLYMWACSGKWLLVEEQYRYTVVSWKLLFL